MVVCVLVVCVYVYVADIHLILILFITTLKVHLHNNVLQLQPEDPRRMSGCHIIYTYASAIDRLLAHIR